MAAHHCHAEGCSAAVPPKMFACRMHWRMVPGWLQQALWNVYRPGQEISKQFTRGYLIVQTRCRLAIAHVEGRDDVSRQLIRTLRDYNHDLHDEHERDDDFVTALDAFILAKVG